MNKYYYSINHGSSWEGPFTEHEINDLRVAGIIDASTLLRQDSVVAPAPVVGAQPVYPEPPKQQQTYMVMINGVPQGPYSIEAILPMLRNGMIKGTDLAWKEGMNEWKPLYMVVPATVCEQVLPKLDNFSLKQFFSGVLKHHTEDELNDCFIAGTRQGTPPLSSIDAVFPSPWIFARVLLFCLVVYAGFYWAYITFQNPMLIPGLMFVGNFGVPISVFLLFFELNIRRDVSMFTCVKALVGGGLLSLIVTHIFSRIAGPGSSIWAGPIEEPAKLLAAIMIAGRLRNGRILTGMLLGAAVGTGFEAFESAGYSRLYGIETQHSRALEAPFAHIIWTAITAGAYWMVQKMHIEEQKWDKADTRINFNIFTDFRFLMVAILPVGLHMLWNSGIPVKTFGWGGNIGVGIIGWIIALRLAGAGIAQIKDEKTKSGS